MDIKKEIFQYFKDKVDEKVLELIIEDIIVRQHLHDCMFFKMWHNYRENIYNIIENKLNYMKQKNEKKLVVARCFYSICNDKDILEKISTIE